MSRRPTVTRRRGRSSTYRYRFPGRTMAIRAIQVSKADGLAALDKLEKKWEALFSELQRSNKLMLGLRDALGDGNRAFHDAMGEVIEHTIKIGSALDDARRLLK